MSVDLFNKLWYEAEDEIFRLETLPIYRVKGDWEYFQKYLKGQINRLNVSQEADNNWGKQLKSASDKGVRIRRVKIVSEPLNDYTKYESLFWSYYANFGDHTYFMSKAKYAKITADLNFNPEDFWMFDNQHVIIFHYRVDGGWKGEEEVASDQKYINKCIVLKDRLLKESVPMKKWLDSNS